MKELRTYFFIGLISLLPFSIIFFTPDLPHTSDGGVQLPRMAAYAKAVMDLHIPVRWAGDLNYGYGLPLFTFIYQTPFFVATPLILAGVGLVLTFKVILAISFVLSGVFMYAFANSWLRDSKKALLVTIFYQFAPFRLVEILVRGAVGGIYAYTFLPLVLFGLTRLTSKPSYRSFIITSLAVSLLILSHNSLSLAFFVVTIVYLFIFARKRKYLCLIALVTGLGLSAYYWIPALLEHRYTYGDLFMKTIYRTHFPPLRNFFIPNFFNNETLRTAEISVQFGLFHTFGLIISIYLLLFRKHLDAGKKKLILFSLCILIATIFMMNPLSEPLWAHVALLRQFQFPWRLLAVATFALSLLSLPILEIPFFSRRWGFSLLILLTVITTAYYWYPPQGFDKVDEREFWDYPLNTTYFGETDVIWSAGPAHAYPNKSAEVIAGQAIITDYRKKTQKHSFSVNGYSESRIVDHTQYFPGWRVYVDGRKTPVEFQDQNWRGEITFAVPRGNHSVVVSFEESPVRLTADALSLLTGISLVGSLAAMNRKKSSRETPDV